MRNYVHIMLCVSLLMAHTVFVGGVDIPKKEMVRLLRLVFIMYGYVNCSPCFIYIACLFCNSCSTTVSVSCSLHVDVNGGCGLVCNTSESVCTQP